MKVFVATTNSDKFEEIQAICPPDINLQQLNIEVDEIQSISINQVARKKASEIRRIAEEMSFIRKKDWLLVDDSGFGIKDLGCDPNCVFFPGALFKLWYGCQKGKLDIVKKYGGSEAQFSTAVALSYEDKIDVFHHTQYGKIACHIENEDGFDTDTFFIPNGYTTTIHNLGSELKNKISPRATVFSQAFFTIQHNQKPANE